MPRYAQCSVSGEVEFELLELDACGGTVRLYERCDNGEVGGFIAELTEPGVVSLTTDVAFFLEIDYIEACSDVVTQLIFRRATPTPTPSPTPVTQRDWTRNLTSGWNLVGFGPLPVGVSRASELLADMQADGLIIDVVARMVRGRWEMYVPGLASNDYCLEEQSGLLVYVAQGGDWTYTTDVTAPPPTCP